MEAEEIRRRLSRLSERELAVFKEFCGKDPYWKIGNRLGLSEGTIKAHMYNIRAKLELQGYPPRDQRRMLLEEFCPELHKGEFEPAPNGEDEPPPLTPEQEEEIEELQFPIVPWSDENGEKTDGDSARIVPIELPPPPRRRWRWSIASAVLGAILGAVFSFQFRIVPVSEEIPEALATDETPIQSIEFEETRPVETRQEHPLATQTPLVVTREVTVIVDVPTPLVQQTATRIPTEVFLLSSFDGTSLDLWTVERAILTNPGIGGSLGGQNDGHLRAREGGSAGTGYYIAPPVYHTDWRVFAELRIDLWSAGGNYYTSGFGAHGDIYLANGDLTAQRLLPQRPPETWQTFVIPLVDDGLWTLGIGTMRLEDVLANVTDFQIRAEYGKDRPDSSGLDNVMLLK